MHVFAPRDLVLPVAVPKTIVTNDLSALFGESREPLRCRRRRGDADPARARALLPIRRLRALSDAAHDAAPGPPAARSRIPGQLPAADGAHLAHFPPPKKSSFVVRSSPPALRFSTARGGSR